MRTKNEIVLSTIAGWKISSEAWIDWLTDNGLEQIDFYGCSPAYSPFTYKKGAKDREQELKKWKTSFDEKNIRIFSYTPEMRNYPLNLADCNEEVRRQTVVYCENAIRDAAFLGAEYVRIQAGYYYLGERRVTAWEQMCRSMEQLLPAAGKEGVCILTGPEDYDVTNVIDGCERTVSLFEEFRSKYMKVFLPTGFLTDGRESAAWYANTLGEKTGALGASAVSKNLKTVLDEIASIEKLPSALPLILELSGENHVDRYLSSIKKGFEIAGKYGR